MRHIQQASRFSMMRRYCSSLVAVDTALAHKNLAMQPLQCHTRNTIIWQALTVNTGAHYRKSMALQAMLKSQGGNKSYYFSEIDLDQSA